MSEKPVILLVEDDDFAATVTAEMLSHDFTVQHVENGESALEYVANQIPSLVLLDVSMPGLSGYDICRKFRGDSSLDGLPVIFLSGMVSEEERVAGYEAGGDDYLTKPVAMGELRSKVNLALKHYAENRRLKEDLEGTFSTAMTAMTTAADMGSVLQFLRASYGCNDYESLGGEMLKVLGGAGLDASIQIRSQSGVLSIGSGGVCSPLEVSVLNNMAGQGRLFEFSSCLSCTYAHMTVIIKNVNRNNKEAHGRLRDNLALLVEGADARIVALDAMQKVAIEHQALTKLIENTKDALQEIDRRYKEQSSNSKAIFQELQSSFERRLLTIGITVSQEDELAELIQNATYRVMALYDEGMSTEAYMDEILGQLELSIH